MSKKNIELNFESFLSIKIYLVIIVFMVTLAPYFCMQVLVDYNVEFFLFLQQHYGKSLTVVWHVIILVAQANHIFDPFLYAYSSQKFRKALKAYLGHYVKTLFTGNASFRIEREND